MNIIIVDDDKLVSLSLKTILEASGEVNVCAIGNCGEEALSLYPKFKPDILLMDIRMDGMSGLTAGKQIYLSCRIRKEYLHAAIIQRHIINIFHHVQSAIHYRKMHGCKFLCFIACHIGLLAVNADCRNHITCYPNALAACQHITSVSYTHLTLPTTERV